MSHLFHFPWVFQVFSTKIQISLSFPEVLTSSQILWVSQVFNVFATLKNNAQEPKFAEVCMNYKRLSVFKINSVYNGAYISQFNVAIFLDLESFLQNISETENHYVILKKSLLFRSDIRFFGIEKWTVLQRPTVSKLFHAIVLFISPTAIAWSFG